MSIPVIVHLICNNHILLTYKDMLMTTLKRGGVKKVSFHLVKFSRFKYSHFPGSSGLGSMQEESQGGASEFYFITQSLFRTSG